tara:strand:- start:2350 stop:3204 length:855 start_codon:yes stop_codon:yes gene_type:complete
MQGPTGLGSFLSSQPAISQRQIDPATGFPARPQSYGAVMGRPDFGSIGRNASKGKSGSKGGAKTFNPESQAVVDEYNRNPDPTLGKSLPPPTYGTVTGLPSGLTPEQARIRQEELSSRTGGGFSRLAPSPSQPPNLDLYPTPRPTLSPTPNVQVSDLFMDAVESAPFFGNNPPPSLTQGLPERPMMQSQGPESLMGEITQSPRFQALRGRTGLGSPPVATSPRRVEQMPAPVVAAPTSPSDVQQQIMRQIQMEQAGFRPNVRPTMNVGKATGGPVGLASLIGRY